jgi:hypothetical protein
MVTVSKANPSNTNTTELPNLLLLLKNRVVEANDILKNALTHQHKKNKLTFLGSMASYAKMWEQIAEEAYEYGLHGLCDVCMLFQASALDADSLQQDLKDNHKQLLEQWGELFIAYIEAPELNATRNALVSFLQ